MNNFDILNFFDGILNFVEIKKYIQIYEMENYSPIYEEGYYICHEIDN